MKNTNNNGNTKAAFNKAANPNNKINTQNKGHNAASQSKFTTLRPDMTGPKPPAGIQNSVNRQIHKSAQQRLALKANTQNQFAKAAHNKSNTNQQKNATLKQSFNQAKGRTR